MGFNMPLSLKRTCLFIIASLTLSSGCRNSCQQLCNDVEAFAESCGYKFTDEMKRECMQNQGKKDRDGRAACNEAIPLLEEEWSCEDLEVYFDQSTISGEDE